jgi:hypothetical protein
MPETMGVTPLIKLPHGGAAGGDISCWCALQALDGRGADLEVMLILQIPGETFGAKVRFVLDGVVDKILGLWRQSLGLPMG